MIPATQEGETRGSRFKASLSKISETLFEKQTEKIKQKI
jgi:hypothetical protein